LARTLKGKTYTWRVGDKPIGSGDAGEVYTVTCLENPSLEGVMKKPARIATGGTIQRQAEQIAQESLALARLDGLPRCKAHPPRLLDVAPDFTHGTANFFMVSETAFGEDMAHMLTDSRQSGKPFPRRVIITVLDALFDLFARAHKAGVLWNDVKLDHIYWHNPTGQVAVIDWGNAQFLDQGENKGRRILPRWEDYQQLVDTLGGFLKQSAPDLYADLGWDEFQEKELDLPLVSVLARRIAYQQEVVGLRVMEYQALIRVDLSEEPNLERLQKIVNYQHRLNEIGAPWNSDAVLEYSQSLVLSSLANGDRQTAIKTTSIIWDLFDETLELPWHLLREYFRNLDIISHNALFDLVNYTINKNWTDAIWTLASIAREKGNVDWWDRLVPVLRQKALGTATPGPYQIGLSILDWAQSQKLENENKFADISNILLNWRQKGEGFNGNPFDYQMLGFLQQETSLPRKLMSEAKSSFASGQNAVREVIKSWDNMNWDSLQKSFRQVISWDPDRWGVLFLSEAFDEFIIWLNELYEGPSPGADILTFFDQIIKQRPGVERVLGSPGWLKTLLEMFSDLKNGEPVSKFRMEVTHWCPWLLGFTTIYDHINKINDDEIMVRETLTHFEMHLKNWSDLDTGLEDVKRDAPQYHPACKKIIKDFQAFGNLNTDISRIASECQHPAHEVLDESCQVIISLSHWRGALAEKDYQQALSTITSSNHQDWRLIIHACKVTKQWIDDVQPLLEAILNQGSPHVPNTENQQLKTLIEVVNSFQEFKEQWQKIYVTGINTQLLESLTTIADSMRVNFLEWRRIFEHSKDHLSGLLYYYDLDLIRQVSDNLLRLSQHCRQAQLSFSELREGEQMPFSTLLRVCNRVLDHLLNVEKVLISSEEVRHFPAWVGTIQSINNAKNHSERRDLILEMSPNHPLYAWLVQSLLAQ